MYQWVSRIVLDTQVPGEISKLFIDLFDSFLPSGIVSCLNMMHAHDANTKTQTREQNYFRIFLID